MKTRSQTPVARPLRSSTRPAAKPGAKPSAKRATAVGGDEPMFDTPMAVRWEKEFASLHGKGALNQIDAIVENRDDYERTQLKKQAAAVGDVDTDKIGAMQDALDIVGLIPGIGEFADALNVGLSLAIGDFIGAA